MHVHTLFIHFSLFIPSSSSTSNSEEGAFFPLGGFVDKKSMITGGGVYSFPPPDIVWLLNAFMITSHTYTYSITWYDTYVNYDRVQHSHCSSIFIEFRQLARYDDDKYTLLSNLHYFVDNSRNLHTP